MMKLIDLTPRHGGEAYMGGYDRSWNPHLFGAKRAEWFRCFDHVREKMEQREPAKLWRTPTDEVAEVINRIHTAARANDDNPNSNVFVTLNADDLILFDDYLFDVKRGESDYAALAEILIDAHATNLKNGIALKRIQRGFNRAALWLAFSGTAMGAMLTSMAYHFFPGL